jgi:uncharacterized repeat protein (TIGR01451 family)
MSLRIRGAQVGVIATILIGQAIGAAQTVSLVRVLSTPNPVVQGQKETFTAGVNWIGPTAPSGTITLYDTVSTGACSATNFMLGVITLGSATSATPGAGTLSVSSFPCLGRNVVVGQYSGDATYTSGTATGLVVTALSQFTAATASLSSTPDPSTSGQTIIFSCILTYTLANNTYPSGTVTFTDTATGTTLGTGNVQTSGTGAEYTTGAALTTSSLAPGTYAMQASYSGDNIYSPSTSHILNQVVQAAAIQPSTTTLSSTATQITLGQPVTLKAVVSSNGGIPSGTVSFNDGTALLGTLALDAMGQASLTTSSLTLGTHSITAAYGGSGTYGTSTSTAVTVTVTPVPLVPTTTVLGSSANPATAGASIALSATVAPSGTGTGTPTGSVTFTDTSATPAAVLGSAVLQNGVATLNVSLLAGTHALTASYGGDSTFAASMGTLSQVVNTPAPTPAPTTTTVTSNANPSVFGQTVSFKATVSGGSGIPTGTVTITVGAITSTVTLSSGSAVFTTAALPVGSASVSATYSGDSANAGSNSAVLMQTVSAASTTTSVMSSLSPSVVGASVTFTATASANAPGSGTPAGTVSFAAENNNTLCASVVVNSAGNAACTTSALTVGSHTVTATYSGNANYNASSGQASQMVSPAGTTTKVTSSVNPSTAGQQVNFTAAVSVTAPGSGTPTGTVSFTDGGATLCSPTLPANGTATCSTSTLAAGSHTITAAYSGDSNFHASSGSVAQTVAPVSAPPPPPASADLAITKTAVARSVLKGHKETYILWVKNKSHNAAKSVVVTDALPDGTVFESAFSSAGSCKSPDAGKTGTVTCSASEVSRLWWVFITVKVTAPAGSKITNTATVASATPDPDPSNNKSSVTITVRSSDDDAGGDDGGGDNGGGNGGGGNGGGGNGGGNNGGGGNDN